MKKFKIVYLLVFILSLSGLSLTSCDKDDETVKNYFNVDGKERDLVQGFIELYGLVGEGVYNNDLIVVSSGINFTGDEPTGTGSFIYAEMFTSLAEDLKPGTYTFGDWNPITQQPDEFTFDVGVVYVDVDMAQEDFEIMYEIKSGTIRVAKEGGTYEEGSIYKINYDWLLKGDYKLEANYEGSLSIQNQEGFKSIKITKVPFTER